MTNFIKVIIIIFANSWMLYAADTMETQPDRHRPLSHSSITVGCRGISSYLYCPLGDLMRGPEFLKKEYQEVEARPPAEKLADAMAMRALLSKYSPTTQEDNVRHMRGMDNEKEGKGILHDHPGITIDIEHAISSLRHKKINWLNFNEKIKYEDVFLEQLPPAGHKGGDIEFMRKAIKKAHDLLKPKERLVICLALDATVQANQLKEHRLKNPFFIVFNGAMVETIKKYVTERKGSLDHPVVKAVNFYEDKFKKLVVDAVGEELGEKKYKDLYSLENITHLNISNLQEGTRSSEILAEICKLAGVFLQEGHMITYLNENGFQDAKLEWLDAGTHHYSPSGGWFITAFKKA